jgi:hypothetical protein
VKNTGKKKRRMTEEQRLAAIERLAKAREKRLANAGPPQNIHPNVYALPDDHKFSYKQVRSWIKTQKELLGPARSAMRQNQKGAIAEVASIQAYIRHCEWYLKHGDWIDDFYGQYQEKKMTWTVST